MKTYETERLVLRSFNENDLDDVYDYIGNAENVKYLLTAPQSKQRCLEFIRNAAKRYEDEPCSEYHFAVVLKETDRVIGTGSLSVFDSNQGGFNWVIHRNFQRLGYGTELGKFLLKLSFEVLKLRRVVACCDTKNEPSYRLMEKIGMRREGYFIGARPAPKQTPNIHGDEYAYGMLREEYFNIIL